MKINHKAFWDGWKQVKGVQRPGQYVWNALRFGCNESWPELFHSTQLNIHEAIERFEERYGAIEWDYAR